MSYALHIVPVGRSLAINAASKMTGAAKAAVKTALDPDSYRTAIGSLTPVRQALRTAATAGGGVVDPVALFPGAATEIRAARATPALCAEWRSLEIDKLSQLGVHHGDAFIFVATDTEAGLLAAAAVALGTANSAPIRYVDDPGDETFRRHRVQPGEIHVCRIPRLDLASPDNLGDPTWRGLGSIGHVVAETARRPSDTTKPWRIALHLSGGYKAMIPSMLVMAEAVSSVLAATSERDNHGAVISAWALHEDAPDSSTSRIPVSIRQLRGIPYRELYAIRDDIAAGQLPAPGNLIGSCLDTDRRITPVGTIMTAVLPATDPAATP